MPQSSAATIPRRAFGSHTEDQISVLGLGGHPLGDAEYEKTAVEMVNRAVDAGMDIRPPRSSPPDR